MRVKRAKNARKKRKKILKANKGFLGLRKSCYKKAKEAFIKAGKYSYRDRKVKKRQIRRLWQIRINNAARENDLSYSKFIKKLKDNKVELDRKVLSQLACDHKQVFDKIVEKVK
ncbi:MAG: 50S ribosomal protein L20 [Candidatus Moranbacteria bacterium]|nr:50S ribosomal protein L20 [Candidatus Moranbacteria bacterium]